MKVEVLGPGCAKCNRLYEVTKEAVESLSFDVDLVKVEEISRMVELGMWATPGFAVDGEVVFSGKIPSVEEIRKALEERAGG